MESVTYEQLTNNLTEPTNNSIICNKLTVATIIVSVFISLEVIWLIFLLVWFNLKPISTRGLMVRLNN